MDKMKEVIIASPRKTLFNNEQIAFQGANAEEEVVSEVINNLNENYFSVIRGDAEQNESWKQPIPYSIIRKGDNIFTYKRLSKGGEGRLHDKLSIGVGGHMNPLQTDANDLDYLTQPFISDVIKENAERELFEELSFSDDKFLIKQIGLVNDDSDSVGKVHLGILNVIDVSEETDVTVLETEQLSGDWVKINDLKQSSYYEQLESWSQIAVNIL